MDGIETNLEKGKSYFLTNLASPLAQLVSILRIVSSNKLQSARFVENSLNPFSPKLFKYFFMLVITDDWMFLLASTIVICCISEYLISWLYVGFLVDMQVVRLDTLNKKLMTNLRSFSEGSSV